MALNNLRARVIWLGVLTILLSFRLYFIWIKTKTEESMHFLDVIYSSFEKKLSTNPTF